MFSYQLVPPTEAEIWKSASVEKGKKASTPNSIAISLKSNDSNSPHQPWEHQTQLCPDRG